MIEIEDWILFENLRPFVDTLAGFVDYRISEEEWEIIRYGVIASDEEADPPDMFEYYIEKFNFRLGQNHGTGILIIHLSTPHLLAEKARLVIDLMGQYYFSHKY